MKSHGAVGDGVSDDTAAIQAAIDEVIAKGGGSVTFPAGTYAVSAPVEVYSPTEWLSFTGVMLIGEGEGSRILRTDPQGTHTIIHFNGP